MKIIDCFIETMAFTLYFTRKCEVQPFDYNDVLNKYDQLIANSRKLVANDEIALDRWNKALFAICAWVDEKILLSNWTQKDLWQRNTLQKQYFRTSQAGEKFFEIFEALDSNNDRQIIQVFNYCIKLGFQGKNFNNKSQDSEVIDRMDLVNFTERNIIFPESYKDELTKTYRPKGVTLRGVLTIAVIVSIVSLLTLNFVYRSLLDSLVSGYFK